MKKIATLFLTFLCYVSYTQAQTSGGPDAYGYIWRDSNDPQGPAYNWIDILPLPGASEVRFLADDNIKGSFPIGFSFHYYWYDVTQFWVGSNGYIGFTNGQISHPFPMIPSTSLPQNYLGIMTSDLIFDPGNNAECWRWTSADNDTLVVSYIDVPFWDQTSGWVGSNTFQVILSAVDSSITYQYQTQSGSPANLTSYASIGIENNSGNIGLQHSYNALPASSYAIKYYYPSNTTFAVSDASTSYNDNTETGGLFLSKNGSSFTMTTEVKNTGNQNLSPFNVFTRVVNGANAIQAQNNTTTNTLTPGQTQVITGTNVFNPTVAGTFRFLTNTQLSGDATPSNDQKVQELVVVDTTQSTIRLSYDNGVEAGLGGLSWQGGNGGAAIYFKPPFYPCNLTEMYAYIVDNPMAAGCSMVVYDDNGTAGAAGTRLDSVYMGPSIIAIASWNTATLPTPLTINSGGVYVAWVMDGDGLTLGQNQLLPVSNRTFEILGNAWADYRYRETEDLMINVGIKRISGVSVEENVAETYFYNFYPSPANNSIAIDFSFPSEVNKLSYEIYDVQGRLMDKKDLTNSFINGKLIFNTESYTSGIYSCRIVVDGHSIVRRFSIAK
ncbi:MAG: T9SS type A sorting domain-containing protein [Bacteroidetes bacterium]|nr:T9SS type A sorting domain-containing protein [Bacteroidota bacterium]